MNLIHSMLCPPNYRLLPGLRFQVHTEITTASEIVYNSIIAIILLYNYNYDYYQVDRLTMLSMLSWPDSAGCSTTLM